MLTVTTLLSTGARRETPAGVRTAIGRITAAFTLGQFAALAVSALGHLDIPARPVEAFRHRPERPFTRIGIGHRSVLVTATV